MTELPPIIRQLDRLQAEMELPFGDDYSLGEYHAQEAFRDELDAAWPELRNVLVDALETREDGFITLSLQASDALEALLLARKDIADLKAENERYRKLMLQAEIWLGVHHGDCSCTARGLTARLHEALGGNDASE